MTLLSFRSRSVLGQQKPIIVSFDRFGEVIYLTLSAHAPAVDDVVDLIRTRVRSHTNIIDDLSERGIVV